MATWISTMRDHGSSQQAARLERHSRSGEWNVQMQLRVTSWMAHPRKIAGRGGRFTAQPVSTLLAGITETGEVARFMREPVRDGCTRAEFGDLSKLRRFLKSNLCSAAPTPRIAIASTAHTNTSHNPTCKEHTPPVLHPLAGPFPNTHLAFSLSLQSESVPALPHTPLPRPSPTRILHPIDIAVLPLPISHDAATCLHGTVHPCSGAPRAPARYREGHSSVYER